MGVWGCGGVGVGVWGCGGVGGGVGVSLWEGNTQFNQRLVQLVKEDPC